jgi:hypothetical protein
MGVDQPTTPDTRPAPSPSADGPPRHPPRTPAVPGGAAGEATSPNDNPRTATDPPLPLADRTAEERGSAFDAGAEYLEQSRASVANYYIHDHRAFGVYVEGAVSGDVAHDLTKGVDGRPGARQERARRIGVVAIDRHELERLATVIVAAGQHERARDILEREHFVVLQGPAGVGKGAAAMSLLGLDREVLDIDPSVTSKDLAEFKERLPFGPGRRYLVQALSSATAVQLSGFLTRAVTKELGADGSYLVVTVDERVALSAELDGYVVPWRERPQVALALRRHLAHYLPDGDVAAVEQQFDMTQLHAGLAGRSLRTLDEVARTVVRAFRDGEPFESVLEGLGFGAQARLEQWFAEEHSLEELAFLLAVAVLGGCPYTTVASHAQRLEQLIAAATRIKLSKIRLDPRRLRSQRLRDTMAVLRPGVVDTEFGRCPADIVQLENRWLRLAALDIVWHEYDLLADALLSWLYESGADPDPLVRVHAAAAAGWLSQYDFAVVRQRLLLPWALGSTCAARSAADALGQATHLDSTAPLALALLDAWAWRDDHYDLWWTAAASYGGETGVRYPGVAMTALLDILDNGDKRAAPIVVDSVVRLVTSGGRFVPEIATQVLHHLTRWARTDPVAALAARWSYVQLLRRAADAGWPSSAKYRQLLVAAENQDASARLLRASLDERTYRRETLDELERLVRALDRDDGDRDAVAGLLARAAAGPECAATDGQRLLHYLDRWAYAPEPSPAARDIAATLRREPSP